MASENLGREVIAKEALFTQILPELVTGDEQLWYFGRGLALGSKNPQSSWVQLSSPNG